MMKHPYQCLSDMSDVKRPAQDRASVQRSWQVNVAGRDAPIRDLVSALDELRTVHDEVAGQNHELKQLNEELVNLLQSAAIPIVCVDRNFAIRRITPAAEYPFNLQATDVGRLITDIRPRFTGVDVKTLVRQAIDNSTTEEADFIGDDGLIRRLRVHPYRAGHREEGATLILIEIRRLGENIVDALLESIVGSFPGFLIVLDEHLRTRLVSQDFLTKYGLLSSEVVHRKLDEIVTDPFGSPDLQDALKRLLIGQSEAEEIELLQRVPGQGERAVMIIARRVQLGEHHQFVVAIRDITDQKQAHRIWARALIETEDALQVSHQEMRALTARLLHTQDEERRRLSRELHDDLSQNMAALQIDVEILTKRLPPGLRDVRQKLTAIRDSAQRLADDLRRIAHGLHPSTIEILGLPLALNEYASEFSQRTGIAVAFDAADIPSKIAPEVAASIYHIVQEALRNIAKHASGSSVVICLAANHSELTLSIRDSGPGFDRDAVRGQGGLGLVSMEERARLIRARFHVDTAPGQGVSITVSVPLAEERALVAGAGTRNSGPRP
jgi:PAS domain S-box-containing protein